VISIVDDPIILVPSRNSNPFWVHSSLKDDHVVLAFDLERSGVTFRNGYFRGAIGPFSARLASVFINVILIGLPTCVCQKPAVENPCDTAVGVSQPVISHRPFTWIPITAKPGVISILFKVGERWMGGGREGKRSNIFLGNPKSISLPAIGRVIRKTPSNASVRFGRSRIIKVPS